MKKTFLLLVFIYYFGLAIGAALGFLYATDECYGYELLEPHKVIIEGEKYDVLRDPYMYEETEKWVYGAALTTEFTLVGNRKQKWRLFYDPTLAFRATDEQVRYGSLYYEAGAEILQKRGLRVFRRHYSGHVFENFRDENAYPVLDSWVVQLQWLVK